LTASEESLSFFRAKGTFFVVMNICYAAILVWWSLNASSIFRCMYIYKIKNNLLNWIKTEHQIDDCRLLNRLCYVARDWDKTALGLG